MPGVRMQAVGSRARARSSADPGREARLRAKRKRKQLAALFFLAAFVVALTHVLEHAGIFQVFNPGLEDFLIGFPTAGGLAILGGIALGK